VCDGGTDKVVGILDVRNLLRATGNGDLANEDPIERVTGPAFCVPESKAVLELIEDMRRNGRTFAIIVDEFGAMSGVVTFKQLVGEIVGRVKQEGVQESAQYLKDGIAHIDGAMRVDQANQELGLGLPEAEHYHTVAGFLIHRLGHIPQKGERIALDGLEFEVAETSGARVTRVMVVKKQALNPQTSTYLRN
jgi:putative hemolysin